MMFAITVYIAFMYNGDNPITIQYYCCFAFVLLAAAAFAVKCSLIKKRILCISVDFFV